MKLFHRGLAVCLAVLHAGVSWSQAPHPYDSRVAGQKTTETPMSSVTPVRPAVPAPGGFTSVLSDYRRFNADEPFVDWRTANEEVKNAGGHVGLMRAATTDAGKGRPRAGQPAPADPHQGHHK